MHEWNACFVVSGDRRAAFKVRWKHNDVDAALESCGWNDQTFRVSFECSPPQCLRERFAPGQLLRFPVAGDQFCLSVAQGCQHLRVCEVKHSLQKKVKPNARPRRKGAWRPTITYRLRVGLRGRDLRR